MSEGFSFSIQKFEDVDFHYLLRLQVGDVVKSWAIPKGPSPDPRVRRLAIPVDIEMEIDFEGVLEEGDKRGNVIVWDSGTYRTYEIDGEPLTIREGLENGQVGIWLEGQKLQGGFSLLRIEEGASERWLMMKMIDEKATSMRNPVVTEPLSVISGKPLEEID